MSTFPGLESHGGNTNGFGADTHDPRSTWLAVLRRLEPRASLLTYDNIVYASESLPGPPGLSAQKSVLLTGRVLFRAVRTYSRSSSITQEISATSKTTTAKILVAEDLPDLREAITIVLIEHGYTIQTAKDGLEAVEMFSEFKPDLVILDMRMPKMSGEDVCGEIREKSDVPIIMFTSTNDTVAVKDAIKKGATDFVLKSTGVEALIDRVAFHLAKYQGRARAASPAPVPPVVPSAVKRLFVATALIVEPDENNRSIIRSVITRLGQNVIEVSSAAEAISAFNQHKPDILITEWTLPDLDAFNMLTEFKPARRAREVIKLMISSRLSPEAQRKAKFVGFTEFLLKPLEDSRVDLLVADSVRRAVRVLKSKAAKVA
ncbi:MAG: response regulator [Chloroflexi bacterium]|nr:response regulator [Chloroflexota bacterium]